MKTSIPSFCLCFTVFRLKICFRVPL
uniref:Uncharacterized protein n=1 Tax=Anguilla anguilla TaxID=7936 RepID=A0A0E9VAF9_ANGAN